MLMTRSIALFCLLAYAGQFHARGQGCSDAGACSAGAIGQLELWSGPDATTPNYRNSARLGFSYAVGEKGTTITQVLSELNLGLGKRFALQLKLPYVSTHGDLGSTNGVGDMFATTSYAFIHEAERNLSGALGLRLPTGEDNLRVPGYMDTNGGTRAYPMPYQTGLGTVDLVLGVRWRHKRYVASVAYQQVLTQDGNRNEFTHISWNQDPIASTYFESYQLRRGNDLIVRAQYAYGCGRLTLQPGALAIYHLQEDSRLNDNIRTVMSAERIVLVGSKGLTLNATMDLRFAITDQWALEASFAAPVITRDVRPDGLTRESVTSMGVHYRF